MGSYHSHPEPEVKVPATQIEDEDIEVEDEEICDDKQEEILKKLHIITEKIEKMEQSQTRSSSPPSLSAVSVSGTLPIKQMSRFQMCMKEIRNNPWLSQDYADRPYENL